MQPNDYSEICNDLQGSVLTYYKNLRRDAICFMETKSNNSGGMYLHFLVDKKHVIRYGFSIDRDRCVGGPELGIGPVYFDAAYFWTYEDSRRFVGQLDAQSVFHNLRLMDEFLHRDVPQYVIK